MIFPIRRVVLNSTLRPADAAQELQKVVLPRRSGWAMAWNRGKGNFMGEVTDAGFSIVRDIAGRNSFLPQVKGTIEPGASGSRISVSMKMHMTTTVFMAIWLFFTVGGLLDASFLYYQAWKTGKPMDAHFYIILAAMALFGFLLMHLGFGPEAKKAETFLKQTLKAEAELPMDGRRAI
jgi:hypothetical protein